MTLKNNNLIINSNFLMMTINENYKELLEVAEMFRDFVTQNSIAYNVADKAIKNYYKHNKCPHRLKSIKTIATGGGCETTISVCDDCGISLSEPDTDC